MELIADLALPPPRAPEVVERIAEALEPRVRVLLPPREAFGASGAGLALALTAHLPVFLTMMSATALTRLGRTLQRRRWTRRLAREGILIPGTVDIPIVSGKDLRRRSPMVVTFELAGVPTTARVALRRQGGDFAGACSVLCLPDARPRWIHVLGPDGFIPFRVDPIVMPDAKLLRR